MTTGQWKNASVPALLGALFLTLSTAACTQETEEPVDVKALDGLGGDDKREGAPVNDSNELHVRSCRKLLRMCTSQPDPRDASCNGWLRYC